MNSNAPDIWQTVLAAAALSNPRNDTANILELPDGTWLVAWHRYQASIHGGDDMGSAQVFLKRSCDQGASWDAGTMAIDVQPGDLNTQAPALCLLPSGILLLACLHAHASSSTTMSLYASQDKGHTWKKRTDVWRRSEGQWLQGGASSIVQLRSGRLLIPFHGGTGDQFDQVNLASCFISDDDGNQWRRIEPWITLPRRGAMEPSVAELPTGRLIMSLRSQLGKVMLCHSDDAGETWSKPESTELATPESCTCLRAIPGTEHLLLLWNHSQYDSTHHHFGKRSPLTMAISSNQGKTWSRITNLVHDPSFDFTNLNCTFMSDGQAAVTFWACSPPFSRDATCVSELRLALLPASLTGAQPIQSK